jgi:hypothetical protein
MVWADTLTLDFDSVSAPSGGFVPAAPYLSAFGITLSSVTEGGDVVIARNDAGSFIVPPSSPNTLTFVSFVGQVPNTFTLNFGLPLERVSFTRPGLLSGPSGVTHPQWTALAINSSGSVVATAGQGLIAQFSDVPPATFVLSDPAGDIRQLVISSDNFAFASTVAVHIDNLQLTGPTGCQLTVGRFSQGDPRWNSDWPFMSQPPDPSFYPFSYAPGLVSVVPEYTSNYNHSVFRIGEKGCALSALAMALRHEGIGSVPFSVPLVTPEEAPKEVSLDPGSLNLFMTFTPGDFTGSNVNWTPATRTASRNLLKYHALGPFDSVNHPVEARALVDAELCSGHPVIVGVKLVFDANGTPTPGHYVLITGKQNGQYLIADPGSGATDLTAYSNQFALRGSVKDPPGDISALAVSVVGPVDVAVTDDFGRRTGVESPGAPPLHEIPRAVYFRDSLENDVTGAADTGVTRSVDMFQPSAGIYRIAVSGLGTGPYTLTITPFRQDGSAESPIVIEGQGAANTTSTFVLDYANLPGTSSGVAGGFAGGGQRPRDVNKFLTYSNPVTNQTSLPAGTSTFPLQVIYGATILPATFQATLNGVDVTSSFTPRPGAGEVVVLNFQPGRNVLQLSVDGTVGGVLRSDRDRLVFLIP